MEHLWRVSFPYWQFVFRGAVIYISVLMLLRLGGKRQVGQMGVGEFVAILLISNAVQNAMNGGDNSITGGLILSAVIVSLSVGVAYLTYKSKWQHLIQGHPTLLIHRGNVLHGNMRKEMMNNHELKALLRRQGIHETHDVAEAVLESDGTLSVTKISELQHSDSGATEPSREEPPDADHQ
jgi:uncharacterized membrane protein YcaP (DUF421 family)